MAFDLSSADQSEHPLDTIFSSAVQPEHPLDALKSSIHKNWELVDIPFGQATHFGHYVPANTEGSAKANVFFMPGCGTSATRSAFVPNWLSQNGMDVFATRQFFRSESPHNIEANIRFIEQLFTDPRSPIRDMMQSLRPFYVVSHSSTPLMMHSLGLMKGMDISRIDAMFSDSAFYDASGGEKPQKSDFLSPSDRLWMEFKSNVLKGHAHRHQDAFIGDPLLDKAVVFARGSSKSAKGTALREATHGEGLTYKLLGEAYYEELERVALEDPNHPALNVLEFSYAGTHDPASSTFRTNGVAALRNRTFVLETEAEHDGFSQDRYTVRHMLAAMDFLNKAIPAMGRDNIVIPDYLKSFAHMQPGTIGRDLSGFDLT